MNKSTNDKINKAFFNMKKYLVILLSIIMSVSGQDLSDQKKKEIFEVARLSSKGPNEAPDRRKNEGKGPYKKLVIRGGTIIDGTGGPASGPVDIIVEDNKIVDIARVGVPKVAINESKRPKLGNGKT